MDKHEFPSIEQFAAFLDGNLSQNEMQQFSYLVNQNDMFHQLTSASHIVDDTIAGFTESDLQLPPEIANSDFELPEIDNVDDSFGDNTHQYQQEGIDVGVEGQQEPEIFDERGILATSYRAYGESGENLYDPVYIKQPDDHSCGLRSQQIVLRDFGIDIPFNDLESIAKDAGVYSDYGTSTYDVGKVLEIAGVGMHQVQGCTIYDLANELSQGHRVIVSVDADELWFNNSLKGKLANWFNDVFGNQGGNHALIVAGIEVNPLDTNDVKIVLTDPGTGHLRIEYPLQQFIEAWKDSNCFMVATNEAAPYQYDANTHMEVPSNFVTEHQYNKFVLDHSYQLAPDLIKVPIGYQPAFTGHINVFKDNSEIDDKGYLNSNESEEIEKIEELTISDPLCEKSKIGGTELQVLFDDPSGINDLKNPITEHDIHDLFTKDYSEQGNNTFATEKDIDFDN